MRFSIRDLLWLTLVVAMGLGWWMTNAKRLEAVQQAQRQRAVLEKAWEWLSEVPPVMAPSVVIR
jgi:hypothetical protein